MALGLPGPQGGCEVSWGSAQQRGGRRGGEIGLPFREAGGQAGSQEPFRISMSFMGPKPSWYGNIGNVFKIFVHWSILLLGLKIRVHKINTQFSASY